MRYTICRLCKTKEIVFKHHYKPGCRRHDADNKTIDLCFECHILVHDYSCQKFFKEFNHFRCEFLKCKFVHTCKSVPDITRECVINSFYKNIS